CPHGCDACCSSDCRTHLLDAATGKSAAAVELGSHQITLRSGHAGGARFPIVRCAKVVTQFVCHHKRRIDEPRNLAQRDAARLAKGIEPADADNVAVELTPGKQMSQSAAA